MKNNGTIVHEAVVLKTDTPYDQIPVDNAGDPPAPVTTGANKVSEDNNIGETGDPDLKPGGTRTFTIKHMTAGNYVIVCNLAGHYAMGMRAPLTVTNPSAVTGSTYSVQFSVAGGVTTYSVLQDGAATALSGVPFTSGKAIEIDGQAVTITGSPARENMISSMRKAYQRSRWLRPLKSSIWSASMAR